MRVGRTQVLPVWVVGDAGVLLGDRNGHVILPRSEDPGGLSKGDVLTVFVYTDTNDRLTATRKRPLAQVGEVAMMAVVGATAHGVFVDWGLPKDLFIPWKHQHTRLDVGDRAVVYVALDDSDRPVGWTKLVDILVAPTHRLTVNQAVDALVYGGNDLGVLCVVDGKWSGILYDSELERAAERPPLRVGDTLTAYVVRVRDDGKLDLALRPVGREGVGEGVSEILAALERSGGFLPLTDHSPPEQIRQRLGLSKKVYKKAIGALYRERRVRLDDDGVRLIQPPDPRGKPRG